MVHHCEMQREGPLIYGGRGRWDLDGSDAVAVYGINQNRIRGDEKGEGFG